IIDIDISTTAVSTKEGHRFYVFLRDITEQNIAKKALIEAKESAEQASRIKSEFLANMSHEIRTPMTSILGMAELLSETELDGEQQEFIERLRHSGDALIAIINDILDLSKIEAGQVHLEEVEFDFAKEMDKVISIFDVKAREKGITITLDKSPNIPARLMGDPVRLRQVLINLLGNSVKFTDSGRINITAAYKACEGGKHMCRLHISISDTGIGIEHEQLEDIFSEFVQADTSTTRLYGGTGLGLTISKKLVQLMGGEIRAESEVGKGSTFYITLDMKEGKGPNEEETGPGDEKVPASDGGEGLKILLVEDSEDNRLLVKIFLKNTPHLIDMAENGAEAFERFTANEYDLILMDMQMPVMDGYEATRIIRKWEEDKGLEGTPIIAFTAHALKEEVTKCMMAGCTDHIAKPVKKKSLLQTLSKQQLMMGLKKEG
ncbi:MAG: ATP-binding protein, partial [bacterium]|nr:ATP-binding protein [bacterium]